jgi:hypothetical protein
VSGVRSWPMPCVHHTRTPTPTTNATIAKMYRRRGIHCHFNPMNPRTSNRSVIERAAELLNVNTFLTWLTLSGSVYNLWLMFERTFKTQRQIRLIMAVMSTLLTLGMCTSCSRTKKMFVANSAASDEQKVLGANSKVWPERAFIQYRPCVTVAAKTHAILRVPLTALGVLGSDRRLSR